MDEIALDFDLDGIADVCDWSFIRRKIRAAIVKDAAKQCVFPNKVVVPTSSADPMAVKCFDPTGLVAIKVVGANGLPRKKGFRSLIGQDKPDTYVKVRLGANEYETTVCKNDTDPVWEDDWFYFMVERPEGHTIKFLAFDEDSFSKDDFLGKVLLPLESLVEGEVSLALEGDSLIDPEAEVAGDLNIMSRWMPLTPNPGEIAVLTLFVYSCNNLIDPNTEDGIPSQILVRITQAGHPDLTTSAKKNTQQPNFEEGFTIIVKENWQEHTVTFQVLDDKSSTSYGQFDLCLGDLLEAPLKRKILNVNPDVPVTTMTLSAKLSFA